MWRYLTLRRISIVALETLLLVCCIVAAVAIKLERFPRGEGLLTTLLSGFVVALIFQAFLHLRDLYGFPNLHSSFELILRLGQALLLASGVLWFLLSLFADSNVGRDIALINLGLSSLFLIVWHTFLELYFGIRAPISNLLILGTGPLARELVKEVLLRPSLGFMVRGFVDKEQKLVGQSIVNPTVLGDYSSLPSLISEHKVDRIIVELQDRRGTLPTDDLLRIKTQGIAIEDAAAFYERITGKVAIKNLKPSWLIFESGFDFSTRRLILKDIVGVGVSLIILILFLPLIPFIMLLVTLDSAGPAFHCQERVGHNGRTFTLWKFRTMHIDAESDTGPVWAETEDRRVTRVGRILRSLRLDELPQLYNVLRGDMSLVGPRPERPTIARELAEVIPYYHLRHTVRPGITGWAQINRRYVNTVEESIEKLEYDLFYIKHMSWILDLLIILETMKTVLLRREH